MGADVLQVGERRKDTREVVAETRATKEVRQFFF